MENQETSISEHLAKIVDEGQDVRGSIASAVRESIAIVDKTGSTFGEIADKVISEAVKAATNVIGERGSDTVAREVIDGLGDGLQSTAHAIDLALSEARSKAEHFAEEDLGAAADDLRGISDLIVESANNAAEGIAGSANEQGSALIEHAKRTAEHLRPKLEAAASAALGDLQNLAKQTTGAGLAATRHAIGTLLTEIGTRLKNPAISDE